MKLLYLHQYFRKPTMNGGVRSYEFARRLVRDGHQVIMITSDTENDFKSWRIENIDGIEVHWVSVKYDNSFGFVRRLIAFFKFIVLSTLHILPIKVDKIIATSTPLTIAIPAMIYKFFRKKPFIFEVRDVWPEVPIALGFLNNKLLRKISLALEVLAYNSADTIIALSPDMKCSIQNKVGDKIIDVIPNASDIALFKVTNQVEIDPLYSMMLPIRMKHQKVVFYTGTLGLVNNLRYLLELAKHSNGEIAFLIIGSGKEKAELEALSKDDNTYNRTVYFFDAVPKNKLFIIHHLFDLACSTVLPIRALYSNSANKIFDAFASGTPILINHPGWLKRLIMDNECGISLGIEPSIFEYNKLHEFVNCDLQMSIASQSSTRLGESFFNREALYAKFLSVISKA